MAISAPFQTLQELREAVIEDSKAGSISDTTLQARVERFINQGYQDVIVERKRDFLDDDFFYVLDDDISGTCTVTNGSTTVTYDTSTTVTQTSGYLYKFFAGSTDEIYNVSSINTSTRALTLESAYTGNTDTSATGNLVQSGITLSNNIKTVYQVWHDERFPDVKGIGTQEFNETALRSRQEKGKARYYNVNGRDSASSAYLNFYPYADEEYTLKLHGTTYFSELTDDSDEPLIPPEYRQILYWYAISRVYANISRNAELYTEARQQYERWLGRMDAELAPFTQEPKLTFDKNANGLRSFRQFRNQNRIEPD